MDDGLIALHYLPTYRYFLHRFVSSSTVCVSYHRLVACLEIHELARIRRLFTRRCELRKSHTYSRGQ